VKRRQTLNDLHASITHCSRDFGELFALRHFRDRLTLHLKYWNFFVHFYALHSDMCNARNWSI